MYQKSLRLRALMVLLLLILMSVLLAGSAGAAPTAISRVAISNVRDVGFTVSWVTDTASNGIVDYGTSTSLGTSITDGVSSTTTHYVDITSVSANMTYFFRVRSGSDVDNNSGLYYQVHTGIPLLSPPGITIWGYVYQSNGTTVVPNSVVYLQLKDANGGGSPGSSQLVSARADSSGVWNYNLGNVRTDNFQAYFSFGSGDNLRLIGQGGSQGTRGLDPSPFIIPAPTALYQQNIVLNQAPTAVTLAHFSGAARPNSIRLDWTTGTETGLIGFFLYRSDTSGGVKNKLNSTMIRANIGGPTGSSYQYLDSTIASGRTYFYWIELVMRDGNEEHGPYVLASYPIWLPMIK